MSNFLIAFFMLRKVCTCNECRYWIFLDYKQKLCVAPLASSFYVYTYLSTYLPPLYLLMEVKSIEATHSGEIVLAKKRFCHVLAPGPRLERNRVTDIIPNRYYQTLLLLPSLIIFIKLYDVVTRYR